VKVVGWGQSPHASSFNLLTASKKLQSVLNFGQNVSWKLQEIYWKSYLLICYTPWIRSVYISRQNVIRGNQTWLSFVRLFIVLYRL